ncbi:catabolic 3-dehydroquinate dehydratase [Acinetobacter sp. ANC 3929]|uniref:type I 3-dehydroquinate dehydratase n=1 Tax=unclassified Acinetobacter TaxID=196816 RepID=UPI0002CF3FF1|nr:MULTISPECIES: type I 3-dehydroquinate dehydratase [unclassified Acinetobacter]ENW79936.1 catabolic 3-dehydroquinate dehydratase [Acinetobacter sp. ANC 3929]MCH7352700.1 type I 3-dehydroquinate dehydratase [Acinetobacter sp. NIPH 2023]MCH7357153.1 type I 3-dehydroquinate dehydratase [Acinetobacter sp. NIPH 1958]MCH7360094.1 type I 3-dehydroquinate dehydratase [Acinetobacter sp. NIPH 2024]
MKMKTLVAVMLLVSPLLMVQTVQAQDIIQKQVELSELAKLPVKTIVPITAKTKEQAIAQAKVIAANADADLAEFRIDLLNFASDSKQVIALGHELKQILGVKPMIATIRTHNEGGQLTISDADYGKTYQAYLQQPFMDMLDVEMFRDQQVVKNTVKLAHEKKVLIVMSNHDFQKTPPEAEIIKRLLKQDELGADILKIAVMPQNKQDVFNLMNATLKVSKQSKKPLLTMSMGKLGTISRIATANMGGSFSFGMIGEASAPGQIDVTQLKQFLKTVQPTQ